MTVLPVQQTNDRLSAVRSLTDTILWRRKSHITDLLHLIGAESVFLHLFRARCCH